MVMEMVKTLFHTVFQKPRAFQLGAPSFSRGGVVNLVCAVDRLVKPMGPKDKDFFNAYNPVHRTTKKPVVLNFNDQNT